MRLQLDTFRVSVGEITFVRVHRLIEDHLVSCDEVPMIFPLNPESLGSGDVTLAERECHRRWRLDRQLPAGEIRGVDAEPVGGAVAAEDDESLLDALRPIELTDVAEEVRRLVVASGAVKRAHSTGGHGDGAVRRGHDAVHDR